MASRITTKINRQVLQNICKSLYASSSESTAYPRSSISNDTSSVASTITITSTTINNNNGNAAPQSPHITIVPPTTPVTNPPPSTTSSVCTQNQPPNTIGTDELSPQDLSCTTDTLLTGNSASGSSSLQMPSLLEAYQVCPDRPKTAPLDHQRGRHQFNPVSYNKVTTMEKVPLQTEHLQPGNQPEFYVTEKTDDNVPRASAEALQEAVAHQGGSQMGGTKEPPASETNGGYRRFEESMTYRNLTQPFKLSRLANPFPDPVKEMPSLRISDQEKASQMYAEFRANSQSQAHFAQRQKQLKLKPQVPLQPTFSRHYSSQGKRRSRTFVAQNPKECKTATKVKCKKVKTGQTCPPANKKTSCRDHAYVFRPCTKKEAPYPSYSESCYDEKPFVCRSCPWMDDVHPAFKPKKKNYHTTSVRAMSMSTNASLDGNSGNTSHDMNEVNSVSDDGCGIIGMELKKRNRPKRPDCPKPPAKLKRVPCAWVELDKKEDIIRSRMQRKKKPTATEVEEKPKNPPARKKATQLQQLETSKNSPNGGNFPADKKKLCLQTTSAKSVETTPPPPPPDHQDVAADADADFTSSLYVYDGAIPAEKKASHIPDNVAVPSAVGQSIDEWLAGLHPSKAETHSNVVTITSGGPCPKFPFKPLKFNLIINRKPKSKPSKCPKKSKLPKIVDCPGRKDCLAELFDDVLMFKSKIKGSSKRPKRQPPQQPDHSSDDPCNRKRKPQSEICPGDLLTRRQKDKPPKRSMGNEAFEEAIAALGLIERARSAPSVYNPHTYKQ